MEGGIRRRLKARPQAVAKSPALAVLPRVLFGGLVKEEREKKDSPWSIFLAIFPENSWTARRIYKRKALEPQRPIIMIE